MQSITQDQLVVSHEIYCTLAKCNRIEPWDYYYLLTSSKELLHFKFNLRLYFQLIRSEANSSFPISLEVGYMGVLFHWTQLIWSRLICRLSKLTQKWEGATQNTDGGGGCPRGCFVLCHVIINFSKPENRFSDSRRISSPDPVLTPSYIIWSRHAILKMLGIAIKSSLAWMARPSERLKSLH